MNVTKQLSLIRQRGVAAIEFALVIGLLILVLGGIFEIGRALWQYDALLKATRDGARYLSHAALLDSSTQTTASNLVVAAASSANVSGFSNGNVSITCDTACNANPTYVTVRITGFNLNIGGVIPLFWPTGPASFSIGLGPHTTMRYMPCKSC